MNPCKWEFWGAIFTMIAGTLLHFVYQWANGAWWASILGAVNESTWEHLKMLFWPMVLFGTIEYFFWGWKKTNFIPVKVLSIVIGMLVIIVLFYTYTGILGKNLFIPNILTFILGIVSAAFVSCKLLQTDKLSGTTAFWAGWITLILLIAAFVFFTWSPPAIGLFKDPVSGEYGIK